MPITAVDTITPAFQHTKQQLIQPFRFGQWVRLAFVGLLAGEMGSGGSSFRSALNSSQQHGSSGGFPSEIFKNIDPALLAAVIATLIVTGLIFFIVMTYISSVMRFILFDSILSKNCQIGAGWSRRQGPGWRYFLWQIGFMFFVAGGLIVLVGIPAAFAFGMGWFRAPREHLLPLILGGIMLFFIVAVFAVGAAIVHVLTKDFVVPLMALENVGVIEGWTRLWPMIRVEKGSYAAYVGMKIVLAIVAGIITGIASFILILVVALPAAAVAIAAIVGGKTAGLTWNVLTITAAVVAACILFAIIMFLVSLISVPVIVFFPAYAIYFFAGRYQPLAIALAPPPAPAVNPGGSWSPETPPPAPA